MMNGIAVGLGLLVAGAMVVFIGLPWWMRFKDPQTEPSPSDWRRRVGEAETSIQQREAVLQMLRDLDFDHALGKVTEEDYGPLRQALLVEAANLMVQLDQEEAIDECLETDPMAGSPALSESEVDCPGCGMRARPGSFFCVSCGTQLALPCPHCEQPVRHTDHFCRRCGAEVALAFS